MNNFSNDVILGFDRAGRPVVLPKELRARHTICLGATGSGKSKAIEAMIRSDLLAWPWTQCALLLLDPHGSLFDGIVNFAVASALDHLPIIPFDCRRLDWITCFNPLRARGNIEASTIVSSCVESLLHAWGQWDAGDTTPRLEKWLRTILLTVFFSGGTLGDSLALLRSPELRRSMVRAMEDEVAHTVWQSAASLKESEFQTITESLCNRVVRFVSATMLRLCLNQTGPSLDFSTVMQKGGIVLVSLATAGGAIDEADARTLGSLLLQDLWTAAKLRGKGESGQLRSFRVFVDEASRFLTPTMAVGLAEARGFGLEFFLAAQSATQFQATPAGQQVLNAVLANAHTKVIFNVQHPDDLEILTPWLFRNEINPNQVKHQHYATKTLGHRVEYRQSTSRSTSQGAADIHNWSTTDSSSYTSGVSYGHSESTGESHSNQLSCSLSASTALSAGTDQSHAESSAESTAEGTTTSWATGHAEQQQKSKSDSENHHMHGDDDTLKKIVGYKPTSTFDAAYTDRYDDFRTLDRTVDRTTAVSESDGQSDSESTGLASTRSASTARAIQESDSRSESLSVGISESVSEGESDTLSHTTSDTETMTESTTHGTADMKGGGHTDSRSTSDGVTHAPMLMPVLGKEALPPMFRSVDEQLFIYSQVLSAQPDRHAVVRIGTAPPVQITTPTIAPARISAKGARAWATLKLKRLPFALRFEDATRQLESRRKLFEEKYLGSSSTGEPTRTVRRIKE